MKIGYVKIEKIKKGENLLYNFIYQVIYKIHNLANKVKQDRLYENVFYINNFSEKSKEKLGKLLSKKLITHVIVEDEKDINYPSINSNMVLKCFLPEVIDYCYSKSKLSNKEIYILVEKYNNFYIDIITEIAEKVKVVNIVTENTMYKNLEAKLEKRDIYITVSNNKRKALKKAELAVNLDFKNINNYSINNNIILIDASQGGINIPKFFDGILIKGIDIDTKKVIRTFIDLENFSKQKIIEAQILQMQNFWEIRKWIKQAKIYILNCKNKRIIQTKEFKRIKRGKEKINQG